MDLAPSLSPYSISLSCGASASRETEHRPPRRLLHRVLERTIRFSRVRAVLCLPLPRSMWNLAASSEEIEPSAAPAQQLAPPRISVSESRKTMPFASLAPELLNTLAERLRTAFRKERHG